MFAPVYTLLLRSLQGSPSHPNKVFGACSQGPHSTVVLVMTPSTYVALDADMFRLALTVSGLSQAQLAKKCRVGRATISDWKEGRRRRVSRRTLTRRWRLLGLLSICRFRTGLVSLASSASAPATGALAVRAMFAVPVVAAAVTAMPPTTVVTVMVPPAPPPPAPPRAAEDPVYETPDHEHFYESATS